MRDTMEISGPEKSDDDASSPNTAASSD